MATCPSAAAGQGDIEKLILGDRVSGSQRPGSPEHREALLRLYTEVGFVPIWAASGAPSSQAYEAIFSLESAGELGLDPNDYGAEILSSRAFELEGAGPAELSSFDVSLSLAVLRFLSDVRFGRVNPRTLGFGFKPPREDYDLARVLADALRADRIAELFHEAEPDLTQNELLKHHLAACAGAFR